MHGDMVRFIAFNFTLRLVLTGVMRVPLVIHVSLMDFDNPAADMSGLGIPGNVIADFEAVCHLILFNGRRRKSVQDAAVAAASTRRLRRGSLILPRSGGFPREPRRSESAGPSSP